MLAVQMNICQMVKECVVTLLQEIVLLKTKQVVQQSFAFIITAESGLHILGGVIGD